MCFSLDSGSWAVPPLPLLKFHQDLQYLRQPAKTPGEKSGKIYIILLCIYIYVHEYVHIYDMCDVLQFIPGVPGSHKHLRRLPNLAPNHAGPLVEAGKLSNVIMSSQSAQWANTGGRPSYEITAHCCI